MKRTIYGLLLGILCTAALTGCNSEGKTDFDNVESPKVEEPDY